MFEKKDLINTKHLVDLLKEKKIKFTDFDYIDHSKLNGVFDLIENLSEKIADSIESKNQAQIDKSTLIGKIRALEEDLKEAKKPKRRGRKPKSGTKV